MRMLAQIDHACTRLAYLLNRTVMLLTPSCRWVWCNQKKGAQLVVLEGKRRNVWESVWSDSCLDLHLMSSGAARAMVHAWLLNIRAVVFEGRELPKLLRCGFI